MKSTSSHYLKDRSGLAGRLYPFLRMQCCVVKALDDNVRTGLLPAASGCESFLFPAQCCMIPSRAGAWKRGGMRVVRLTSSPVKILADDTP